MNDDSYRNISFATVGGLVHLAADGTVIEVRGKRVREVRNRLTVIERPRERCLFLPHRANNIIGTVAETIWVIAGRSDVAWLASYLPRAPEYSDDGVVWRGGYGPRLRNWNGVDQLREIIRLFRDELATRRAVISLYDPDRDFVNSCDIPCNNWLDWLCRDGKLNLTVGVRSNDVIWGFSGVNSFQWSVLQEMLAYWVDVDVGDATYLATSFHLYLEHEERARRIISAFKGVTCYDFGLTSAPFSTNFEDLDGVLDHWFALEGQMRANVGRDPVGYSQLGDRFLGVCLDLVRLHHGISQGWSDVKLVDELAKLPVCDLTAAAYEHFSRSRPSVLLNIPDPQIAEFMTAYQELP